MASSKRSNSLSTSPRSTQRIHTPPRDRIDSILETARGRKLSMDRTASANASPALSPLRHNSLPQTRPTAEIESSADEETNIFRRTGNSQDAYGAVNYQSTAVEQKSGTGLPPQHKQSTASIRRAAQIAQQEEGDHDEEARVDEEQSWWQSLLSDYGSLELDNKGSVARDHLALERTFLAWLRTSLAFASIGIAITQLFRLNTTAADQLAGDPYKRLRQLGKPLGATFLGISIVMLFVGFHRYFESQHWIIRGKFPASRGSIAAVVLLTFALMVTSLVIVVVVEPRAYES